MATIQCKDVDCKKLLERLKRGFSPEEVERLGGAAKADALMQLLIEIFRRCCSLEGEVDDGTPPLVGGTAVALPLPKPTRPLPAWAWALLAILLLAAMRPKVRKTCTLEADMGVFCIYDCDGVLVTITKPVTTTGRCKKVAELWV